MKIPRAFLVATLLAVVTAGAALAAMAAAGGSSTQKVTVTEVEYKLTLSPTHLVAGKAMLVVENKGKIAHSLQIAGPGLKKRLIAGTLMPGKTRDVAVTLKSGTYSIWCPVDSHAKLGMKTSLKVGSGSGAAPPAGTTTNKSAWG